MRGNLVQREPSILKRWYAQDLYGMIRAAKQGKKTFILHDGPPYANGSIHIGHSVNKILKDIIIKSKGLAGFDAPYIPGWDCHGLPIELKVEQLYGKPGETLSASEFRQKCREYADEQVKLQKQEFIRLGVLGDWGHSYLTMDFKAEANIICALSQIIKNGHLLKGEKPVHWCTDCCSSLAEAELEYYEKTSPSIDIMFRAVDADVAAAKFGVKNFIGSLSMVIWTTTPWTLPANRAISLHPNFNYQLVQVDHQCFIIGSEFVEDAMKRVNITKWIVLGNCKGRDLLWLRFRHPFMGFDISVILSAHITLGMGTGAVHIAGGHGPEDFVISQKYKLEIINLVGPDGCYLIGTHPILDGKFVFQANELIIDLLRASGALLYGDKIVHNYPCCWRHKTPIIFRATPQWFISMDQKVLRAQLLKEIKSVRWIPAWGLERIETMVANRPDWCISRQRTWGVPLSLWVHKDTGQLHPRTVELMQAVAKKVERSGIQAWWDLDSADFLGDDADNYLKVLDTLDVWFDSGVTHTLMVKEHPAFHSAIADVYLEGTDQYRGWFMSSLIISMSILGTAPYRDVLTHGFTVDHQGRKMSKSIGNIISPQGVINRLGGDILRFWVASTNYTSEIAVSDAILQHAADSYRRIRNTVRFLLANLTGFEPSMDCVVPEKMIVLDRWVVGRALSTQEDIIQAYANYNFHEVIQCLMKFCSVELGSFYLDIIKDRQYTAKSDSIARRSCQTALFYIAEAIVRWISPIMSFTADEIWNFLPGKRSQYVFTEEWYQNLFSLAEDENMNNTFWAEMIQVRKAVNKVLEKARANKRLGSSLEAAVILYADNILLERLTSLQHELRFVLLTSAAYVAPLSEAPVHAQATEFLDRLRITLHAAKGEKCLRCWHYTTDIGLVGKYTDICNRCMTNLVGEGEKRHYV